MAGRKPATPAPEPVEAPAESVDEAKAVEQAPAETPAEAVTPADPDVPSDVDLLDVDAPDPDEDKDPEADRAAALAALAAGETTEVEAPAETVDETVDTSAIARTGKVYEWGGDTEYLVVSAMFFAEVGPKTVSAKFGDVVKPNEEYAERGLRFGALAPL